MELRDLAVTPLIIILVLMVAYFIRPYATDENTRRYFFPALSLKIFGAIALGLVYQFYYGYGDTLNFHVHGSRHVWETFSDSFSAGIKLLFGDAHGAGMYKYYSKVILMQDPSSFAVIRIASIFDLITFSSYTATAVLFAVLSFAGGWMFFLTFYEQYPHLHRPFALAMFAIPSIIFWGSGLLKDTVTLACIGGAVFFSYQLFIKLRFSILSFLLLLICLDGLYVIKIYMLFTLLPALIIWIFLMHFSKIKSTAARVMSFPVLFAIALILSYTAVEKALEDNAKYSLNNIASTAQITAYDIRYWTGKDAGSGYSLGDLDGTFGTMLRLAPQAINVSLFRPYLWEVKNPLMLLSALEGLFFFMVTFYIVVKRGGIALSAFKDPNVVLCFVFALSFAFAVGVSTFNYGTLARYKIPLLPFYAVGLVLMMNYENNDRKFEEFEETE